jgi:hypothetical protein
MAVRCDQKSVSAIPGIIGEKPPTLYGAAALGARVQGPNICSTMALDVQLISFECLSSL